MFGFILLFVFVCSYHPDRSRHLATMRERVEAEEIFEALKTAYDEISAMMTKGAR